MKKYLVWFGGCHPSTGITVEAEDSWAARELVADKKRSQWGGGAANYCARAVDESMGGRVYMPDRIKERSELAHTYAEDGAYASAARVLEELALEVRNHANVVNAREQRK